MDVNATGNWIQLQAMRTMVSFL